MIILAFDTSSLVCSVAILDGEQILAEARFEEGRRTAQELAPTIDRLLRQAALEPSHSGLIATTLGPGSFTGLRVGVTTAKTLAYAVGCDVIGLDTLDVIAAQAPAEAKAQGSELHAVLDAQRDELFLARYVADDRSRWQRVEPNRIVSAQEWLKDLQPGAIVTGKGCEKWLAQLQARVEVVDASHWEPRAATVGRMALAAHQQGRRDNFWTLAPAYLRGSAAEEKAKAKPAVG